MIISKLDSSNYLIVLNMIQAFPDLMGKALQFQNKIDSDPTRTIYLISTDKPVGWIVLGKINPGDKAEFGIGVIPEGKIVAVKAAVKFMKAAFQVYGLKKIYSIPVDAQAEKALIYVGFIKNNDVYEINFDTLERKWQRWKRC